MNIRIMKTMGRLKRSSFRSKFRLADTNRQYVNDKGIDTIRKHAYDFITSRIAPQYPKNDGKQTPMKNHPVFIAQHATATCCRGCIQKWHKIKKGTALTDNNITFIVTLVMIWIELQMKENSLSNIHPS